MAHMLPKRVVFTGLGAITPLGPTMQSTFEGLLNKVSNTRTVSTSEVELLTELEVKTLGMLDNWDRKGWMAKVPVIKSVFHALGMNSSEDALLDANWEPKAEHELTRTGVMFGSARSSSPDLNSAHLTVVQHGYARLERLILTKLIPSMIIGTLSVPRHICGFANSFCSGHSTGIHAIGDASRTIGIGDADLMISGSSGHDYDSLLVNSLIKGDHGYNLKADQQPGRACRPFDKTASGWVYSIGAGCAILEELQHAKERGAQVYAEVLGYSSVSEMHRNTASEGTGVYRAMKKALKHTGVQPSQVSAVFSSATGYQLFDLGEARAIEKLLGNTVPVTSIHGGTGHMQDASSSVNVLAAALAIKKQQLPPITNLTEAVNRNNYVLEARDSALDVVVVNSVNFSGAGYFSIVLRRV